MQLFQQRSHPQKTCHANQRGSILLGVIAAMTVVATLGIAIFKTTTTTSFTQTGYSSHTAYYLAEAGGRYAINEIKKDCTNSSANIAALAKVFNLSNGDRFSLALTYDTATWTYTLVSSGIPQHGGARKISYAVACNSPDAVVPPGDDRTAVLDMAQDARRDDLSRDNWNWTGGDNPQVRNNSQTNYLDAVELDNTTWLSLDWTDRDFNLLKLDGNIIDLYDLWAANGNKLSYEVQVKVKTRVQDSRDSTLAGISFRYFDTWGYQNEETYALSFLEYRSNSRYIPDELKTGLTAGRCYVLLWVKDTNGYRRLGYVQLGSGQPDYGLLSSGKIKDWSTLLVRIQEVELTGGARENRIRGYVRSPDGSPSYPRRAPFDWTYANFTELFVMTDNTLTTENFDSISQDEIGLHHRSDDNSSYWDDFSIRFLDDSSGGISSVYQY